VRLVAHAEVVRTADRVVLIEDTRELQCKAPNLVALRTKDGVASLSDLVRSPLRLRPDRIPIGEVRGAELIAETINLIAVLAGRGAERKLVELAIVKGIQPGGDYVLEPAVKSTSKGGRS
jgi:type IV secretion system protein VirB11